MDDFEAQGLTLEVEDVVSISCGLGMPGVLVIGDILGIPGCSRYPECPGYTGCPEYHVFV